MIHESSRGRLRSVGDRLVGGLAVREWGDPAEPGILLWPGLGSMGTYFGSVVGALPGRGVAVDPPGCAWLEANALRFPDWGTAIRELALMVGSDATPALDAYVRDVFSEVDGEIRERARPDRMADLLLAVLDRDALARAQRVPVPTLPIACGQPPERRATREKAWQRFAQASALIELHVADGWGHNPILQDPEGSSSVIADWLQAHP